MIYFYFLITQLSNTFFIKTGKNILKTIYSINVIVIAEMFLSK